jgi:hypothetical protein
MEGTIFVGGLFFRRGKLLHFPAQTTQTLCTYSALADILKWTRDDNTGSACEHAEGRDERHVSTEEYLVMVLG